jgi:hypothetical protein
MTDLAALVDRCERDLARRLDGLASAAEMLELELDPDPGVGPIAGTRPAVMLRDASGRRFFFKAAEAALVAGEVFAYGVRRLGRRPTIPVVARSHEVPGIGQARGMLQPFVEHLPGRLETDATQWSELQREAMVREHPWEWLLANFDTHVDQYVFMGEERYPLNVDWDHSLMDLDITTLDRFTKRLPAIAPVRNMLYDAYVHGRLRLHFSGMRREMWRIARLDERQLRPLVEAYAAFLEMTPEQATRLRHQFAERRRHLVRVFERFIASLRAERHSLRAGAASSPRALAGRVVHAAQDAWQRLVVVTLHDHVLGPFFRAYRWLLALRARRDGAARKAGAPPLE